MALCGRFSPFRGRWLPLPTILPASPLPLPHPGAYLAKGQRAVTGAIISLLATVIAMSVGLVPAEQPEFFPGLVEIEDERENHVSFYITKLE